MVYFMLEMQAKSYQKATIMITLEEQLVTAAELSVLNKGRDSFLNFKVDPNNIIVSIG